MTPEALRAMVAAATEFIPGYVVTRDGRVFSTGTNWRGYGVRELAAQPNSHGYLRVRCLVLDEARFPREVVRRSFFVHEIVAEAFLPERPPGHEVRHLNGDRTDNRVDNLAWGTRQDNADDREAHGRTARGTPTRLEATMPEPTAPTNAELVEQVREALGESMRLGRRAGSAEGGARVVRATSAASAIRREYVPGLVGYRQLARKYGVPPVTAFRIISPQYAEKERISARDAKWRRRGTCKDCGAETRYNGHGRGVSDLCSPCANKRSGAERRGQGSTVSAILALLAGRPRRRSEIRDALGITNGHTGQALHRLCAYGFVYRPKRGVYALVQPTAEEVGQPSRETDSSDLR